MKKDILFNEHEKVKNIPLIRKRVIITVSIIWFFIVTYVAVFITGYNNCKNKYEDQVNNYLNDVYAIVFEDKNPVDNKYALKPFLFNGEMISDEKVDYIVRLSRSLELDPDFCISILNTENPELNDLAISKKNKNGSVDIGMWQLNQNNFNGTPQSFDKKYWPFDTEFDIYDWKHNTWIALHHIKDLAIQFDDDYLKVAQAYNGGARRVHSGSVVAMAKSYSERVMRTYNNLKNS